MALELSPGVLVRIDMYSTPAQFSEAVNSKDLVLTCGSLVSMIACNKGTDKTSLDLLAGSIETVLHENAGKIDLY